MCCHETKKGGEHYENGNSIFGSLLFTGALGALNNAMAADGVLLQQEFTPGSYCHMKFPAISDVTLGDDQPVLAQADVIDFYGSCSEYPRGQDQVQAQKVENRHQWVREYES